MSNRQVLFAIFSWSLLLGFFWFSTAPVQAQAQGVCDRTGQVRDAIVAAASVSACGDVTEAHLAAIEDLDITDGGISVLKAGDFSGLTSLKGLSLLGNLLRTVPVGVFAGLDNLEVLDLEYNQLDTLPARVFAGLNLIFLGLEGNDLAALPAGVFAGLTNLISLDLSENELVTLPAGVFAGLTRLSRLRLHMNPGADFTFTMIPEQVSANKVVVKVAEGAPFAMTTTIRVAGGTLPAGVSSVTVPAGHTTSEEITVTSSGEGATVTLGMAP